MRVEVLYFAARALVASTQRHVLLYLLYTSSVREAQRPGQRPGHDEGVVGGLAVPPHE